MVDVGTGVGVGICNVKPHSVEKVISCSQSVTGILDPSPVSVVAQTVVVTGANTV